MSSCFASSLKSCPYLGGHNITSTVLGTNLGARRCLPGTLREDRMCQAIDRLLEVTGFFSRDSSSATTLEVLAKDESEERERLILEGCYFGLSCGSKDK